jgi:AraC-like DNA-binding protein
MTTLDAALRGGAVALFMLLAVLGWRESRQIAATRYGILFVLCAAAYVVESAPGFAETCPPWLIPLRLLSISTPAIFYIWSAAHFDDDFAPGWRYWLPWFGMLALGGWAIITNRPLAWSATQFAALALVALGAGLAVAGRKGDLVEGRRQFRLILAIGAGAFIAALNLLSLTAHGNPNTIAGLAGPVGVAVLGFAAALLSLRGSATGDGIIPSKSRPAPPKAATADVAGALPDAQARELLVRLEALMERDKVYREERFGIGVLAERLDIPEYRLRRLINQHLGHRNFVDFVNRYRLAETVAALVDPAQVTVPILTIALDAGFQSIGPFNRAFKAHTGMTPSEFRRTRLGQTQREAAE